MKNTYHFIIDLVEMNFTDFLYNIFILKSYEAKACRETQTKQKRVDSITCWLSFFSLLNSVHTKKKNHKKGSCCVNCNVHLISSESGQISDENYDGLKHQRAFTHQTSSF